MMTFCFVSHALRVRCLDNHFNQEEVRSTRKLRLVHSDVCGPMPTESLGKKRYFVSFTDDYSRCCQVYLMKHRSEALDKF